MQRIPRIDPAHASLRTQDLLALITKQMGGVPNFLATMAQSPAALSGYLGFESGLARGTLTQAHREQISIAVAGANACDYCASAHTALGRAAGLAAVELRANLCAQSGDPRTAALLAFVRHLVRERGRADGPAMAAVAAAGFDAEAVVEIVANVALNIFVNYFNHVAGTEVDFPLVDATTACAA